MYRVDQLTLSSGEPSLCPESTSQADPELWGVLPTYWVDQLTLSSGEPSLCPGSTSQADPELWGA